MRIEGQALAGEYPAPLSVVTAVATFFTVGSQTQTTICDPFGSDGRALNTLATALGVPSASRFLCELKATNVQAAIAGGVGNGVAGDAFSELKASPLSMSLVWNNPPFDWTNGGLHEKGQVGMREELRAMRLVTNTTKLALLVNKGIHVMIAPETIMRRDDMRREMALWHDDFTVWTYPTDERHFNEMIVIGVKRAHVRKDSDEIAAVMTALSEMIEQAEAIRPLESPMYTVPAGYANSTWRSRASSIQQEAARGIVKTGGVFTAPAWTQKRQEMRQFVAAPLDAFNAEQAAMMVASGRFNGQTVTLDGEEYLIKGFTSQKDTSKKSIIAEPEKTVTVTETIQVPHPMIAVQHVASGKTTVYDGTDAVMQFVADNADAFLRMAQSAAPAMYNRAAFDPALWAVLDGITSVTGRKPRGQDKPGLVERQKHAAAAILAGLTTPNSLTGKPFKGIVAAMEQRCGKTPTSLAVAEALRQHGLHKQPNPKRAFVTMVAAPRLVVGDKTIINKALSGKGAFPAWYATAMDMLPTWKLFVIETPGDLGTMMDSAQTNPHTSHMGFVPLSMFALGPGWDMASAAPSPSAAQRDRLFVTNEQEHTDLLARIALQHRQSDADDTTPIVEYPMGVSERTVARDGLIKPSYRPRQDRGEAAHRCPDCGRVQIDLQDGLPVVRFDTMQDATCQWCNARFAGWNRNYQANERIPAFSTWQHDFALNANGTRAIPWGVRPSSNPRVPLAWLMSRRWKGQIDLFIFDEVHKGKGDGTAISDAMFWCADAATKVLYLTGTIFGGNALDVFNIYWSVGNPVLRRQFGFTDRAHFVDVMGIKKTIVTTTKNNAAGVLSGRNSSTKTTTEAVPGLTINLLEMVLTQTVMTQLDDMGFNLVAMAERKVLLDMPADVADNYKEATEEYRLWLKLRRLSVASSAMQMLWQYPYQPHAPKPMRWTKKDKTTGAVLDTELWYPEAVAKRILPHHEWLAEYIVTERRKGRKVLVFCTHTGTDDLMPQTLDLVREVAMREYGTDIKGIALYSDRDSTGKQVASGARDVWFAQKADEGYDVVLTNPQCVDVGISLLDFPSIVFLEPHYSAFVVSQAKMRAWGPMQDKPCEVVFVAYRGTVSHAALGIVAQKLAAMAVLKGGITKSLQGIAEYMGAMSMFKAIAEIVATETPTTDAFQEWAAPAVLEQPTTMLISAPTDDHVTELDALLTSVCLSVMVPAADLHLYMPMPVTVIIGKGKVKKDVQVTQFAMTF